MSRGIGSCAKLVAQDKDTVCYEYSVYDLNEPEHREAGTIFDGEIWIDRDCFPELVIHRKIKKMPSGRKQMVDKTIIQDVAYGDMIAAGRIRIKNASHCFRETEEHLDVMALHLIYKIFVLYQENGEIQEKVTYDV